MDHVQVDVKSSNGCIRPSTLLKSRELNQAMLNRSLSEPKISMFHAHLGMGLPSLVRQPVEQGKLGSWGTGFHKMVKKLLKPVFWKKKQRKDHNDPFEQGQHYELKKNDLKFWKRFSKSVRYQ
ncbi:unnamed protein product [Amaranthus hypochondriacus]